MRKMNGINTSERVFSAYRNVGFLGPETRTGDQACCSEYLPSYMDGIMTERLEGSQEQKTDLKLFQRGLLNSTFPFQYTKSTASVNADTQATRKHAQGKEKRYVRECFFCTAQHRFPQYGEPGVLLSCSAD